MRDKYSLGDPVLRMSDTDKSNFSRTRMMLKIYPISFAKNLSDIGVRGNPILHLSSLQNLDMIVFVYLAWFCNFSFITYNLHMQRR